MKYSFNLMNQKRFLALIVIFIFVFVDTGSRIAPNFLAPRSPLHKTSSSVTAARSSSPFVPEVNISIVPATEEHVRAIQQINASVGMERSDEFVRERITGKKGNTVVAIANGTVVGYAAYKEPGWLTGDPSQQAISVHPDESSTVAYLSMLVADQKFQGNGIGTILVREVFRLTAKKGATRVAVHVRHSNKKALIFYEGLNKNSGPILLTDQTQWRFQNGEVKVEIQYIPTLVNWMEQHPLLYSLLLEKWEALEPEAKPLAAKMISAAFREEISEPQWSCLINNLPRTQNFARHLGKKIETHLLSFLIIEDGEGLFDKYGQILAVVPQGWALSLPAIPNLRAISIVEATKKCELIQRFNGNADLKNSLGFDLMTSAMTDDEVLYFLQKAEELYRLRSAVHEGRSYHDWDYRERQEQEKEAKGNERLRQLMAGVVQEEEATRKIEALRRIGVQIAGERKLCAEPHIALLEKLQRELLEEPAEVWETVAAFMDGSKPGELACNLIEHWVCPLINQLKKAGKRYRGDLAALLRMTSDIQYYQLNQYVAACYLKEQRLKDIQKSLKAADGIYARNATETLLQVLVAMAGEKDLVREVAAISVAAEKASDENGRLWNRESALSGLREALQGEPPGVWEAVAEAVKKYEGRGWYSIVKEWFTPLIQKLREQTLDPQVRAKAIQQIPPIEDNMNLIRLELDVATAVPISDLPKAVESVNGLYSLRSKTHEGRSYHDLDYRERQEQETETKGNEKLRQIMAVVAQEDEAAHKLEALRRIGARMAGKEKLNAKPHIVLLEKLQKELRGEPAEVWETVTAFMDGSKPGELACNLIKHWVYPLINQLKKAGERYRVDLAALLRISSEIQSYQLNPYVAACYFKEQKLKEIKQSLKTADGIYQRSGTAEVLNTLIAMAGEKDLVRKVSAISVVAEKVSDDRGSLWGRELSISGLREALQGEPAEVWEAVAKNVILYPVAYWIVNHWLIPFVNKLKEKTTKPEDKKQTLLELPSIEESNDLTILLLYFFEKIPLQDLPRAVGSANGLYSLRSKTHEGRSYHDLDYRERQEQEKEAKGNERLRQLMAGVAQEEDAARKLEALRRIGAKMVVDEKLNAEPQIALLEKLQRELLGEPAEVWETVATYMEESKSGEPTCKLIQYWVTPMVNQLKQAGERYQRDLAELLRMTSEIQYYHLNQYVAACYSKEQKLGDIKKSLRPADSIFCRSTTTEVLDTLVAMAGEEDLVRKVAAISVAAEKASNQEGSLRWHESAISGLREALQGEPAEVWEAIATAAKKYENNGWNRIVEEWFAPLIQKLHEQSQDPQERAKAIQQMQPIEDNIDLIRLELDVTTAVPISDLPKAVESVNGLYSLRSKTHEGRSYHDWDYRERQERQKQEEEAKGNERLRQLMAGVAQEENGARKLEILHKIANSVASQKLSADTEIPRLEQWHRSLQKYPLRIWELAENCLSLQTPSKRLNTLDQLTTFFSNAHPAIPDFTERAILLLDWETQKPGTLLMASDLIWIIDPSDIRTSQKRVFCFVDAVTTLNTDLERAFDQAAEILPPGSRSVLETYKKFAHKDSQHIAPHTFPGVMALAWCADQTQTVPLAEMYLDAAVNKATNSEKFKQVIQRAPPLFSMLKGPQREIREKYVRQIISYPNGLAFFLLMLDWTPALFQKLESDPDVERKLELYQKYLLFFSKQFEHDLSFLKEFIQDHLMIAFNRFSFECLERVLKRCEEIIKEDSGVRIPNVIFSKVLGPSIQFVDEEQVPPGVGRDSVLEGLFEIGIGIGKLKRADIAKNIVETIPQAFELAKAEKLKLMNLWIAYDIPAASFFPALLLSKGKDEPIAQVRDLCEKMKRKGSADAYLNLAEGMEMLTRAQKPATKLFWRLIGLSETVKDKEANSIANCVKLLATLSEAHPQVLARAADELLKKKEFREFYDTLKAEHSAAALEKLGVTREDLAGMNLEAVDPSLLAELNEIVPKLLATYQGGGFQTGVKLLKQIVVEMLKGNFAKWRYETAASQEQMRAVGLWEEARAAWIENGETRMLIGAEGLDLNLLGAQIRAALDQAAADSTFDWRMQNVEEMMVQKDELGKKNGARLKEIGEMLGQAKKNGKKQSEQPPDQPPQPELTEAEILELETEKKKLQAEMYRLNGMIQVVEAYQAIQKIKFDNLSMGDINELPKKIKLLRAKLASLDEANKVLGLPSEEAAKGHLGNILETIKTLDELKRSAKELVLAETDDPVRTFKLGVYPVATCQRYSDGDCRRNKCLLATVADANKKLLNIFSGNEIASRAILKMITLRGSFKDRRAIFFEKIHSRLASLDYVRLFVRHILQKAAATNSYVAIPFGKTFQELGNVNLDRIRKIIVEECKRVGYELDCEPGKIEIHTVPSNNEFEYADSGFLLNPPHNIIDFPDGRTDVYSVPLWVAREKADKTCGVIEKEPKKKPQPSAPSNKPGLKDKLLGLLGMANSTESSL